MVCYLGYVTAGDCANDVDVISMLSLQAKLFNTQWLVRFILVRDIDLMNSICDSTSPSGRRFSSGTFHDLLATLIYSRSNRCSVDVKFYTILDTHSCLKLLAGYKLTNVIDMSSISNIVDWSVFTTSNYTDENVAKIKVNISDIIQDLIYDLAKKMLSVDSTKVTFRQSTDHVRELVVSVIRVLNADVLTLDELASKTDDVISAYNFTDLSPIIHDICSSLFVGRTMIHIVDSNGAARINSINSLTRHEKIELLNFLDKYDMNDTKEMILKML